MIRFVVAVTILALALAGEPFAWLFICGWLVLKFLRRNSYRPSHAHMSKAEKQREKDIYKHELRHKKVANALGYKAKIEGDLTRVWWKRNTPDEHVYAVMYAGGLQNEHKWAWKSDRNECAKLLRGIRDRKERKRVEAEGKRLAEKHHR